MEKKDFYPKNLRDGTHYFNRFMEFTAHDEAMLPNEGYLIPLNKEILEPMGFEAVYDDYTSELYFQRDLGEFRIRTFPMESRIAIIELKTLHTIVSAKAESLNELENYLNAVNVPEDVLVLELYKPEVVDAINAFGKGYWDFYNEREERFAEFERQFSENTRH